MTVLEIIFHNIRPFKESMLLFTRGLNPSQIPRYIPPFPVPKKMSKRVQGCALRIIIEYCILNIGYFCKGKKSAWDVWNVFPQITDVLVDLSRGPDSIDDGQLEVVERFVVLMYCRTSLSSLLTKPDKSCSQRNTEV